ncbi:hypothetical protein J45TS6_41080 [Paenibacillus sp. J45TS6]|uniref:hypothetical protein n=1 Tax=unclassified Paenibacillus TaxID=185978 RepID=UPI001B10EE31|nr:hypothetical protein [Paenibacillus sp. J45TS6]GIP45649.1 hypothetical protein J45TS6_41080 [Paenibacillus sp. J45TS6]
MVFLILLLLIIIIFLLLNINSKIPPRDYVKEALDRDEKWRQDMEKKKEQEKWNT